MLIYPIGTTQGCRNACAILHKHGYAFTDHPCPEITHLLLDIPSFTQDGLLRSGEDIRPILSMVPQKVHIIGGNLKVPCLEGYAKTDLLQDPFYLARNAEITADCALRLASGKLDRCFQDTSALVIGWGRIGKCLAQKLRAVGCPVTVAARKETDRAILSALGYQAVSMEEMFRQINQYLLIFNTVPARLPFAALPEDILAYELASRPGLPEGSCINARGLPGVLAPYSSGKLISETIKNLHREGNI